MKHKNIQLTFAGILMVINLTACGLAPPGQPEATTGISPPPQETRIPTLQATQLPPPRLKGDISLEEALTRRRSVREFTETPLTDAELSQLLWAAQGITHPAGLRTAPSAGALYPLEIFLVTATGVYHYQPQNHSLVVNLEGDKRPELHAAAISQAAVLRAPAVIVIAGVYQRTAQKYGEERSPRYVHLEAGHAAQNILLQAVALDMGAVPIGAFYDEDVRQVLGMPDDHQPLYLIPIGHPLN